MDPIALARNRVRHNPRLRSTIYRLLHARIAPTPLHRLLLAERSLRLTLWYELARVLYYQPLFELQCAAVAGAGRLDLTPESKLPLVDNCALVLGRGWRISARTTFAGARNAPGKPHIRIGDGTYVGSRVVFRAGLGIEIGRHVTIASNVVLSSDPGHPLDPLRRRVEAAPPEDLKQIVVADDVWIAEGATVLGGVSIGEGAIVGAHAVVTRDVPPYAVVAGNPARVIKQVSPPQLKSA